MPICTRSGGGGETGLSGGERAGKDRTGALTRLDPDELSFPTLTSGFSAAGEAP